MNDFALFDRETSSAPVRSRWIGWMSSLKFRLALAGVLIVAISALLTAGTVLRQVELRVERAVIDLELGNAERSAAVLGSRVVALQLALRAVSAQVTPAMLADPAAARAWLDSKLVLRQMFSVTYLADVQGRVLAYADRNGVQARDVRIDDRPYFERTLRERVPVVSEPFVGRISGEPSIHLTMPWTAADGSLGAVLGGSLWLGARNLIDDLTQAGSNDHDPVTTIVTDARGVIIGHPDRTRILRPIDREPGLAAAVRHWTEQGRPVEPTGDVVQGDGHIVTIAGVPGADWVVFRRSPEDLMLGGASRALRDAAPWVAVVALASGALLLATMAWLLRPLGLLETRARRLLAGDTAIDQGWPRARGEIGRLVNALQHVVRERAQADRCNDALIRKMRSVLAAAPMGIAFTCDRRFELVGNEFCALFGCEHDAMVGRTFGSIFASEDDHERLGPRVAEAFAAGRPFNDEIRFRRRDGSLFYGRLQGRPVDAADADAGTIWLLEDVTHARRERERLTWSASHDALTGLANRRLFEQRLADLLGRRAPEEPASVLFIDLDHFKQINDFAGHAAGDQVLCDVAAMLNTRVRGSDTVARLGGDEFAVLLLACDGAAALRIAEQMRDEARHIGANVDGRRLTIGASIGVVEIDDPLRDPAAVMASADQACYAAKHAGRHAVRTSPAPLALEDAAIAI